MDITNNDYDTWKRRTVASLKDPNGFWKRVMVPDYSSDIVSYVDTNLIVAPSQLSTERAIYVFNIYIYIYIYIK